MSAVAIAFQKLGWKVTGSDKGFYPPVSDNLRDAGIAFYPGWHPEKMTADGKPDLVVVGNVAGSKNPEWLAVEEHGIDYKSYPEVVADFLVAKNSIVCAGTYGKSTSSTLLTWILGNARFDLNHMFGGISLNDLSPASMHEDAQWSVVEGDEYKTSRWDEGAKFFHYKPTHLLLTSVVWDHADVYPTETAYIDAFRKLVDLPKEKKNRVLSEKAVAVLGEDLRKHVISYGKEDGNDYRYDDVEQTKDGLSFSILHKGETFKIKTQILGAYNADNITGCFALAHQIGIAPEKIIEQIGTFKGLKRRLERRLRADVDVYDDIAHSPSKAQAVLDTLSSLYDGRVTAVYEPNTGNRRPEALAGYDHMFEKADELIVPRLTKLKRNPNVELQPVDGAELAEVISKTHANVAHMDDDDALVEHLSKKEPGDCVVFLGSHGFRGMIEQTVQKLS